MTNPQDGSRTAAAVAGIKLAAEMQAGTPHDDLNARTKAAYEAGVQWATSLKIGDVFTGTMPAARAQFPGDEFAQSIFSLIALHYLPKPIVCKRDSNIIVEMGKHP